MIPSTEQLSYRTAVVIDDDPAVRSLTVRALSEEHFLCRGFSDATAALEYLRASAAPQIITIDLPRALGLSLAADLRAEEHLASVPLVVMSARHEPGDALLAGRLRAVFLQRQFRVRDLYAVLHSLARNKREPPRILIVDDDDSVRETIEEVMQDEGFEAICAKDGDEALAILRKSARPPQLVILDVVMPNKDGISVAEEIRRTLSAAEMEKLPVLLVSGQDGIAAHAKALGVAGHLKKPVALDELVALVQDVTDVRPLS